MARARQLRLYSRDCFAPSLATTGEHHAYDLIYLQNVDLSKFSVRTWSITPSLRVLTLQLNRTSNALQQVFNQTQQSKEEQLELCLMKHISNKVYAVGGLNFTRQIQH
jgi:hypothetical protein